MKETEYNQMIDAILTGTLSAIKLGDTVATSTQKTIETAEVYKTIGKTLRRIENQSSRMINFWRAVNKNRKRK